jgi:hypothetical protein
MIRDKLLSARSKDVIHRDDTATGNPPVVPLWHCLQAFFAGLATSWVASTALFFIGSLVDSTGDLGLPGALGLAAFTLIVFGSLFPIFALLPLLAYIVCMLLWQRWFARKWLFYACMIAYNVMVCIFCEGVLSAIFNGSHFPRLTGIHAVLGMLAGAPGGYVGWSVLRKRQAAIKVS